MEKLEVKGRIIHNVRFLRRWEDSIKRAGGGTGLRVERDHSWG